MDISPSLSDQLIATAHGLADAARPITLTHFRSPDLHADDKDIMEVFDPVTAADRTAERAMRAVLADLRPDDAILGEEYGTKPGTSGLTWVLDPIDGTRGYICGTPTWGVLIAVQDDSGPLFGLIDQPYIGERFEGGFDRATLTGPHGTAPLRTRMARNIADSMVLSTFPEIGTKAEHAAFRRVADQAKLVRYGMDCYGYGLLATGQVDLVIEAGLQPYDICAPIAVVQAAGGIVTDWQGGPAHQGGQVIAAANPQIHAQALDLIQA